MQYYDRYTEMYAALNSEDRKKSREHWQKCHAENVKSGREDLTIFSAQILARIALVDAGAL